jgi:hypothetical protein
MVEMILDKTLRNIKDTFEYGNYRIYLLICGSHIKSVSTSYDEMLQMMNDLPEEYLRYSIIQELNISYNDFKKVKLLRH